MDWTKAKNILIIAFIITNLFLLYVIINDKNTSDMYLTIKDEFIEEVKIRLLEKNIKIDSDIPKELPSLPPLNIEYEIYDNPEEIAATFLGEFNIEEIDGITYYKNNNKKLFILENREIVFEDLSDRVIYNQLDDQRLYSIVNEFLKEKNFLNTDFKLKSHEVVNGKHLLQYTKVYDDKYIEMSYMKFEIDKTGIKKFQRQWIKSVEPTDSKISIRSAPDSLLRLLLNEEYYGKTIKDIRLCYYLDPRIQNSGTWRNIVKGKAYPAWKVLFDDGTEVFLEEY